MSRAVHYSSYGGPEVLDVVEVEEPHPGAGEVRVAVRAAGLNAFDFKARSSAAMMPKGTLPRGQGFEFAGIVDELAPDVGAFAVGDEVLGFTDFAAQADHVVVAANQLAVKPAALDWATAGGIGLVGNTAMRSLAAVALSPGETVLVSAAAGGVGLIASQLALQAGATVIATASPANHDFLRGLGVIPVAYGAGLADRVRDVAPQGIDAVLDNAGEETVLAALELGVSPTGINSIVYFEGKAKYGISTVGGGRKTAEQLARLAELFASGALVLPIAATYPLAEVRAAYEQLEGRHVLGKIVLLVP
jgi:NADPH:quinone reductase-like Zn-dependent oxidoreductase